MRGNRTLLKVALLSTMLVSASINAITANVPEMAKSFADVSLTTVELVATVPSLFQMLAVLASGLVVARLGLRRTSLLGVAICGVSGVLPVIVQKFAVVFAARCAFGLGCGLIVSTLITLIVSLFAGDERSRMIGLQGSVGGLGAAVATFAAGRLLALGWSWSFAVYAVALPVFVLVAAVVPDVGVVRTAAGPAARTVANPWRDLPGTPRSCLRRCLWQRSSSSRRPRSSRGRATARRPTAASP